MKKYIKYIVGGIGFFLTMTLLDYLFEFEIDLKINIGATVIYLLLNIICDYLFERKTKK